MRAGTKEECSILAAAAYTKEQNERIEVLPPGWRRLFQSTDNFPNGFAYSIFVKGEQGKTDEPVISFAGTDGLDDVDDWFAAAAEGGVA